MIKVCPDCRSTCMGGELCKNCGAPLTDVGDRSKRSDVEGLGISIRALYAARAAMVLFWMGALFGVTFALIFVRESFAAESALGRWGYYGLALLTFSAIFGGSIRLGNAHYRRVLASNQAETGLTGAEADFFEGESNIST